MPITAQIIIYMQPFVFLNIIKLHSSILLIQTGCVCCIYLFQIAPLLRFDMLDIYLKGVIIDVARRLLIAVTVIFLTILARGASAAFHVHIFVF